MSEVRVLVVDDEAYVRNYLKRVLEWAGYVVDVAADGKQAFDMLETNEYQIVTSDMSMAGMNGEELLTWVKVMYPSIRRVMVTGIANFDQQLVAMMKSGLLHDFIAKPFSEPAFLKVVEGQEDALFAA